MQTLNLDRYIVQITSENVINFDNTISMLNEQKYPRGIMEALEIIEGITKIEIYNIDSKELLLNTTILS